MKSFFRFRYSMAIGCCFALLMTCSISTGQEFVPGEIIVKFAEQPSLQLTKEVEKRLETKVKWRKLRHAPHAKGLPGQPHPLSFYRIAIVDEGMDVSGLCQRVEKIDDVVAACVNRIPKPTYTPNDEFFDEQWSHEKIDSEGAWDISTGSHDVVIAIVDTGCRTTHQDIQANIWTNAADPMNGVDDDNNGFVDDFYGWDFARDTNSIVDVFGHGTQVSGIASGTIDNGVGIAGISNARIMTAKWWHTGGSDSSVAESVFYAVDNGAHVMNLSLSCQCQLPLTETAVNFAYDNNVIVVGSSGNAGSSNEGYPSAYNSVISVGAIDINDQRAGFSNYGSHLDVMAPSPGILSPSPSGDTQYDTGFGGTSAAAPHVGGLVALMLSINPDLTPEQVRQALQESADDFGAPGFDMLYGHGRINCAATVAAISILLGDINLDGTVDLLDVAPMVELLTNSGFQVEADINQDGTVDLLDVGPFVDLLSSN